MTPRLIRAARWAYQQPYLLLSIAMLFWAGNIITGRALAGQISPITLTFLRWLGAFALVIPFAWRAVRQDWPIIRRHKGMLALLAACGLAYNNVLSYEGLQQTQAINALILQTTGPLFIALWSFVLYRARLTWTQFLGMGVAIAGVLIVIGRGDLGVLRHVHLNPGDGWVLSATILFSLHPALLRGRPPLQPLTFLAVMFFLGAAMTFPLFVGEIVRVGQRPLSAAAASAVVYVVLFPSIVAYLLFTRGIDLIGAHRASMFLYLMPLFGAVLAMVFLGEQPRLFHAAGFALILTGVALASRRPGPG